MKQWICLMIFWPRLYKCKKCKIAHFLINHIFRFLIISLLIFVLQERTIPQIKAKDILFGPYSFSLLAKINILQERKPWSCLVFFYPDLILFWRFPTYSHKKDEKKKMIMNSEKDFNKPKQQEENITLDINDDTNSGWHFEENYNSGNSFLLTFLAQNTNCNVASFFLQLL